MIRPRSILIIQTAFIGDVILATALVESWHQHFPESQIDFVVRKGNEPLLEGHPFIREVLVFDKRKKFRNLFKMISKVRKSKYDLVVNVQRFATTGIMTALSSARATVGFDKNPLSFLFTKRVVHQQEGRHEVERNHALVESYLGKAGKRPRLYPSPAQFERVKSYKGQSYITVSPASVWFTKQFPQEKWVEFLTAIPDRLLVFLLGAADDRLSCERILQDAQNVKVVNLAGELSLLESSALMQHADMNYVNDSAPLHMASAMNAPVTAIFCSTVPSFGFGPLSDKSFIVETIEKLECKPCGLHGLRSCPLDHFDCAMTIQKEQLLATSVGSVPSV